MDNHNRSSTSLHKLRTEQITQEECQRECFSWLLEPKCWNDLTPKKFPPRNDIIENHFRLLPSEKKALTKEYYLKFPEVIHYCSKRLELFYKNISIVKYLKQSLQFCSSESIHSKVKYRIEEFRQELESQGVELKIKKYIYELPEVKEIQKEFGN